VRKQVRGSTHRLKSVKGGTSQDMKKTQVSKGHSQTEDRERQVIPLKKKVSKGHLLPKEHRGKVKSRHEEKVKKYKYSLSEKCRG
jgi:hypothetical protein